MKKVTVLRDNSKSVEQIGYADFQNWTEKFIIRKWKGTHETEAIIEIDVFYSLDGKYIGNIQRDLTHGKSTQSSRINYHIRGEEPHNLL